MNVNNPISKFWSFTLLGLCLILSGIASQAGPQNIGDLTLNEVAPRIITPNGDLKNDVVRFNFESGSLTGVPMETNVFDVNSAKVAGLQLDPSGDFLSWDGKDDSGNVVPAGIYIYSIKVGKNMATGTIVVAR